MMLKNKIFLAALLLFIFSSIVSSNTTQQNTKEEAINSSVNNPPIVVTQVKDEFDAIKENIELAITGKGLKLSGTLHVSNMLNRTGKDLGFDRQIFEKAESVEFCSALISHKMAIASPENISVCPFTIAVYTYKNKPDTVYIAYRRPQLAGNAEEVSKDIDNLLSSIVEEATQ